MKLFCFIFILFLNTYTALHAQKKVFQPIFYYAGDAISNFSGGEHRTLQYFGLIDAGFKIETDSAQWWKGGMFNLELINTHGKGISAIALNDLQGICGIEAGDHPLLLWALWYYQRFGKLGIRLGFQNINSDFMNQPFTSSFSCGSYSVFPTLSLNHSIPNYPVGGLGVSFTYQFSDKWSLLTSAYNGKVSKLNASNAYNLNWQLNPQKDGLLSIAEVKYVSDSNLLSANIFGAGCSLHTSRFISVTNPTGWYRNNYVFYAFGEHAFFSDQNRTMGLFLQGSYAIKNRNKAYGYTNIGLTANGFFLRKHTDVAGIAVSQLYYQETENDKMKNKIENVTEMFFKFRLNKNLTLKPTFFTIFSPHKSFVTAGMVEVGVTLF